MQVIQNIYPYEIDKYVGDTTYIIIDLRNKSEYSIRHIKGAINITLENLEDSMYLFPKNKRIIVYCATGGRSIMAARLLHKNGFQVKNVIGGIKNYYGSSLT